LKLRRGKSKSYFKDRFVNNHNIQDKIKNCFQINDIEDENPQKDDLNNKRAKTSYNFFKPSLIQENNGNNQTSSNINVKEYNPILRGPHTKINNFPSTTSQGFYNKKNKFYTSSKNKVLNGRFNQNYLSDIEKLSSNSSFRGNTFRKQKGYDGFESYRVPRTKTRAKSEYKTKSLVDNYSRQMMNSLKIGNKEGYQADQYKLNELCQEENTKLKIIINNQSNPDFLAKSKLPKISCIINQPRFLLTNSRTQYSKNLGEKYNPFNFKVDNKNHFKRNIGGSHFLY